MSGLSLLASPSSGLSGRHVAPGDKSISHRALILGAMAEGETRITGLLEGDDVLRTAVAVRAFGADVRRIEEGAWTVAGRPWRSPSEPVDCGNSGTAARLLMGAASGYDLQATFTGDPSLSRRPMRRVLEPLTRMGARFDGGPGLPATLRGGALRGISHVSSTASAQVKSAILLAGINAEGPVEVIDPAPSRDHTERMLAAFGVEAAVTAEVAGERIRLSADRRLSAATIVAPGDPSSAAFLLAAALVTRGSDVTVEGVGLNPRRTGLLATLLEMGADLRITPADAHGGEPWGAVRARASALRGVEAPPERAASTIDEYPLLAVLAAFAEGTTVMRGVGELRVKESDRIAATAAGLRACGVEVEEEPDALIVHGRGRPPPGGVVVATHGDHRIAMSFLVLGLGAERGVRVDGAEMIATSFPGFADLMRRAGARMVEAP